MDGTPDAVLSPAEVYDDHFVPALFQPWAERMVQVAQIAPGARVLDVACGTGALTRTAADRVGAEGAVTGLDRNPEMLAVARRRESRIAWHEGLAEALPFPDDTFDAVVSQFGFMFFEDRVTALREMARVLKPGGRLAVAVCDAIDHSPAYAVFAELLHRLFGEKAADALRAPFMLGDPDRLKETCAAAGLPDAEVTRHDLTARFPSVGALIATERACAWTLGGILDDEQFARLQACAEESMRPFVAEDGRVELDMPALIITAQP